MSSTKMSSGGSREATYNGFQKGLSIILDAKEEDGLKRTRLEQLLSEDFPDVMQTLEERIKRLQQRDYYILVAGETSSGKSCLINLLLGVELLPYSCLSTTSTICEIKYGIDPKLVAHRKATSDNSESYPPLPPKTVRLKEPRVCEKSYKAQIAPYVHKKKDRGEGSSYEKVEIFWPNELLQVGVVIIDSPGVGESEIMDQTLMSYLPNAFAFMYVINSTNAGGIQKDRLVRILDKVRSLESADEMNSNHLAECALFVANKWDQVDEDEQHEVKQRIVQELKQYWPDGNPLEQTVYVSTKEALDKRRQGKKSEEYDALIEGIKSMVLKAINSRLINHWAWMNLVLNRIIFRIEGFNQSMLENRDALIQRMSGIHGQITTLQNARQEDIAELEKKFAAETEIAEEFRLQMINGKRIRDEINELQQKSKAQDSEIQQLQNENDGINTEMQHITQDNLNKTSMILHLFQENNHRKKEIEQLRRQNNKNEDMSGKLCQENNNETNDVEQLLQENSDKNKEIKRLLQVNSDMNNEIALLRQENNTKNKIEQVRLENNDKSEKIENIDQINKTMGKIIDQLREETISKGIEIGQLEVENSTKNNEIIKLRQQNNHNNETIAHLREQIKEMVDLTTGLRQQNLNQNNKIQQLDRENKDKNIEIEKLRQSINALNDAIVNLNHENNKKNEEIKRLRETNGIKNDNESTELRQENNDENKGVEELRQENRNMNDKIDEISIPLLQEKRNETSHEIQQLRDSIDQMNNEIQQHKKEKNEMSNEIQRLQGERNGQLRRHIDNMTLDAASKVEESAVVVSTNVLGRGAYGTVYKGDFHGSKVAVKEYYEVLISNYNLQLLQREVYIASQCRHPNLLQFICATRNEQNHLLIVTELMDMTLRCFLEERANVNLRLSYQQIKSISLDVACGLNYLHSKQNTIVHRDVSSSNVLLLMDTSNQVIRAKISDYGSANYMDICNTPNIGTVLYAAPEAGQARQDPKIDVFSYGILVCEIAICELPDPSYREMQRERISSKSIKKLVKSCTEPKPQDRPTMQSIIGKWQSNSWEMAKEFFPML
ncbi:putative leucine-rich repeat-containing protein DDB_G0290503 [Dendronephthya gigantea]|uniref:putative leucine-rich repeat-containing protein DDB_G0290503 n=1 Tax=Dendronephthya gigantea TaxID=151771 RepID=UPI00106B5FF5|nr:putative leucine-rich repeat-containing protein DDB_G0290503 [Dendronephthya gigantea]